MVARWAVGRNVVGVFVRNDHYEFAGGASAGTIAMRQFGRAPVVPPTRVETARARAAATDWVPDLGANIGGRDWWRGVATCAALCAALYALGPSFQPLPGFVPAPLAGTERDEAHAQSIAPLGLGAGTGRRMAANDLVRPLAQAPERPSVELAATLGEGDRFAQVLARAGVGRADAERAAALLSDAVPLADIPPGTRFQLTLGRRPSRTMPRPLDKLSLRARFDLNISIDRAAGGLAMTRAPVAIDSTPLRIQGLVGASLYRSARAAGAPAKAVESYLRALRTRISLGRDVDSSDGFDLIVEQDRAATGEVRLGELLFAGLRQGNRATQLVRFSPQGEGEGDGQWFDIAGRTERRGFMGLPVQGRISSGFGMRMHPLLGFLRMHKGLDIAAPHGSPVYAAIDGVVQAAGRAGGYGNLIKLAHGGGIVSAYGHLSRFAVGPGTRVRRGEVIGYVGSTGISTGPHLHWEVYKNGVPVNPRTISFDRVDALSGEQLRRFKAKVARLLSVPTY